MADKLYLVVPCYNEEEVLPRTVPCLTGKLAELAAVGRIDPGSKLLLVDDGSRDRTWDAIERFHLENSAVSGLKLSRNQGHQNALLAGLMLARERADIAISMDADLQDDIGVIDGFLQKYSEGFDIVYGVRSDRSADTAFKRGTAQGFYKLMNRMGVPLVYNHADCRLMSKRALDGLAEFKEVNLFLRGIVPLIGYPGATVTYERFERQAGESKYPLKKMVSFALDGITSFSTRPIRCITLLGFVIFAASILLMLYALAAKLLGYTVSGWSTLMGSIWLLGGLQVLALGVIGEYVGKIYAEVKGRPRYFIETILDDRPKSVP